MIDISRHVRAFFVFVFVFPLTTFADQPATSRPNQTELTLEEAQNRSSHVKDVSYQLKIDLRPELPSYTGQVSIKFQYIGAKAPLTIDFEGGTVAKLVVNGKTQSQPEYNKHFLTLPADSLASGANDVQIQFKQVFESSSRGLYRFKDPEDGRIYLYTDFEPYFANRFFPCFDQPDLKAKLKLDVTAPDEWSVISTTLEESKTSEEPGLAAWSFAETPAMSTYLYSLHAGQYHVWKDDRRSKYPLRLFARESIAKYVDPSYWFTITQQGLDYYGEYFDFPYAFKKYDQLIVPDFNSGAMENIAAITFSERFVSRGKMTLDEKQSLANVILHEMAHQWFGNLVTMKWWDDLWLNESFADFMASQSLVAATEFKAAWLDFTAYSKRGAYYEDQLVTTHPVATHVKDTEVAANNFDGITYGKGASALKQLSFTIGANAFRDGIRDYLKKYQFANATLADFLASLQSKAPQFDATRWSKDWLQSAGLNSIKTKIQCKGGKIQSLEILQGVVSGDNKLRQHTTNLALFDRKGLNLNLRSSEKVSYDGATTTVSQFKNEACPELVFPNLGDEDYAQVELAGNDLTAAMKYIAGFPQAELRVILWQTFSQMVRDGKLKTDAFLDLLIKTLPTEREYTVKDLALANFSRRNNLLVYLAAPGTRGSKYERYVTRLEGFLWKQFLKAAAGADEQVLWFETYGSVVESKVGLDRFAKLLMDQSVLPKGFLLDQDRKWEIVLALARQNHPLTATLLKSQEAADPSQSGRLAALAARTASASVDAKKVLWQQIIDPKTKYSQAELKSIMGAFFPRSQLSSRKQYAHDFFAIMSSDLSSRDGDWLKVFANTMRPLTCTADDLNTMKTFMNKHGPSLPSTAKKALLIGIQEDERCIAARRLH